MRNPHLNHTTKMVHHMNSKFNLLHIAHQGISYHDNTQILRKANSRPINDAKTITTIMDFNPSAFTFCIILRHITEHSETNRPTKTEFSRDITGNKTVNTSGINASGKNVTKTVTYHLQTHSNTTSP